MLPTGEPSPSSVCAATSARHAEHCRATHEARARSALPVLLWPHESSEVVGVMHQHTVEQRGVTRTSPLALRCRESRWPSIGPAAPPVCALGWLQVVATSHLTVRRRGGRARMGGHGHG